MNFSHKTKEYILKRCLGSYLPFKLLGVFFVSLIIPAIFFPINLFSITTSLPHLYVEGDRIESDYTLRSSITVLTEEQLKQSQPFTTMEALQKVPGISVRDEDGLGLRPNISMRGIYGNRSQKVLLLEDGIPIALAPYGAPDAYYSPQINRIQSIEIFKGEESILYGPQTIGGVINYHTYDPSIFPSFFSKVSVGNNGYSLFQTRYSNTFDQTGIVVDFFNKQGNGPRDPMPFMIYDITGKILQPLSDDSELMLKVQYYNENSSSTYTGLTQSLYENDYLSNPAIHDKLYVERMALSLTHHYYGFKDLELNSTLYAYQTKRFWWRQDYDLTENVTTSYNRQTKVNDITQIYWKNSNGGRNRLYKVVGFEPRLESDDYTLGARIHYEIEDNKRIDGSFHSARTGTIKSDEERSTLASSLYGNYQFNFSDTIHLVPSLRLESFRQNRQISSPNRTIEGFTDVSVLIPGVGMTIDLSDSASLFSSIHRGFSPPKFSDSIDSTGVDQKLDAEQSLNYQLGTRFELLDGLFTHITGFYTDYSNQIIGASESSGYEKVNGGKSISKGLEIDINTTLSDFFMENMSLTTRLSTAYVDSRFSGGDNNNNRIPYIPVGTLTTSFGLSHPSGVDLFTEIIYVTSMYADDSNTKEGSSNGRVGLIPSHVVVNTNGKLKLDDYWAVFLSIKNVFNETYIASRHPKGIFPGLAQQYMVGFETDF